MKAFPFIALVLASLSSVSDVIPLLYDTTTKKIVAPTNVLGMTFGGQSLTQLVGFGLTNDSGTLKVDTNAVGSGGGGGSGTVTSVGGTTTVSGLGFAGPAVTVAGNLSLTGIVAVASGGSGATDAAGARAAFSLVPGTHIEAWDDDLDGIAALANSAIVVRTGSGSFSARTITGDSEAVVSNGDGVSGNPTISIGSGIARTASPTFTGTVTFDTISAGAVAIPFASRYVTANSSSNLVATSDGGSWTNLNGTEIRSGTVADARIDSAIARDAEVSAIASGLQPLDSDLTAMAAGTAVATPQTNAVSMGAPVLYAGSTNVPAAIALKAPIASPALTGDPTAPTASAGDNDQSIATTAFVANRIDDTAYNAASWNGDTNAPTKNAVRDKIESLTTGGDVYLANNQVFTGTNTFGVVASGGFEFTNLFLPDRRRVILFSKECLTGSGAATSGFLSPELSGVASSSGTASAIASETNHPGIIRLTSAAGANSAYGYYSGATLSFSEPGLTWHSITRVQNTNAGSRMFYGFNDNTSGGNPNDGIGIARSNNVLIPKIYVNGTLQQGYEYGVESNQWLRVLVSVVATNQVRMIGVDSTTGTVLVDTNMTGTLPDSPARAFGAGAGGTYTNAAAAPLEDLDLLEAYYIIPISR